MAPGFRGRRLTSVTKIRGRDAGLRARLKGWPFASGGGERSASTVRGLEEWWLVCPKSPRLERMLTKLKIPQFPWALKPNGTVPWGEKKAGD